MKNTKPTKKTIDKSNVRPKIESLEIKDQNDIIVWSFITKRNKLEITNDSIQLIKKIGKNKPKDSDLIKKMINLHNEYRFPLLQLKDTTQENIDIAHQFLIFLSKIDKK